MALKRGWYVYINDFTGGLNAFLLKPAEGQTGRDIIAFRGSDPKAKNGVGFRADLSSNGIGKDLFALHADQLESWAAQSGGNVTITGHSLGGALPAADQKTARVLSYSAPGLDQRTADAVTAGTQNGLDVTRFVASNDIVPWAGSYHPAGTVLTLPGAGSHGDAYLGAADLAGTSLSQLKITKQADMGSFQPAEVVRQSFGYCKAYPGTILKGVGRGIQDDDTRGGTASAGTTVAVPVYQNESDAVNSWLSGNCQGDIPEDDFIAMAQAAQHAVKVQARKFTFNVDF